MGVLFENLTKIDEISNFLSNLDRFSHSFDGFLRILSKLVLFFHHFIPFLMGKRLEPQNVNRYIKINENNPKIMRHFLLLSNYKQDFQQSFSICLYIMEYNTQWKILYTYQWHYFHNNQLFSSEKKSSCLFTINIQLFVDFFLLLMEQRSHSRKALTE